MINYALQNNLIHEEYVREYTNATFIVGDKYDFEEGMFGEWDEQQKAYDMKAWAYDTDAVGQGAPRSDPEGPALRVPAAEKTLFPL